ncbi:MAG TPA: prepilin-type N-terminal cleavage/methylation domain-containing protein [Hydrogenophaga sp.]|uniref:PulJ/GspJ family protein n=1 Tax=Hydrogenophaga sp. TaxID=1904254 RepID=UPI002C8B3F29|nr:prepilin-type N-terminal cleavage/methylation domain-containing protein [Hydrogenophaga sp.]HMN92511.1 prepilin-type N-terminal cleavage/methylation domain-containing protein [Hydrogenophaga sp.]HMP10451.1 prepilin-type N-terminal cleavage/methylation domain-containing protein [Hydrogenophaga sp.]
MAGRHPRTSRARGLTLIELLVAIVVMSMLALLSWRSIDGMLRTQTLTQERSDTLLRMQSALGQWVADLDAVIDTNELRPLVFDGSLLRLTRRDATESTVGSPGIRVVAWTRLSGLSGEAAGPASGHWVRWESAPVRQRDELARAWQRAEQWRASGGPVPSAQSGDSRVVLVGLEDWQLFYHRGQTWTNPLSATGNEGEVSGGVSQDMPNGVRLVLALPASAGLSGALVRDWVRPTLEAGR